MSTSGALGIAITDVASPISPATTGVAAAPLGSLAYEPATSVGTYADMGERVWIYVYNDSGGALAQGDVLVRKAGTAAYHVKKSEQSGPEESGMVCGVAQHAIPDVSYGFILRKGIGEVKADTGGITANTGLIIGNAVDGTADDAAAATNATFGFATETVAATALATCYLNCQG